MNRRLSDISDGDFGRLVDEYLDRELDRYLSETYDKNTEKEKGDEHGKRSDDSV